MSSTTHSQHQLKWTFLVGMVLAQTTMPTISSRFSAFVKSVKRNAGQLPQPFWLGAARGGGSCGAARCTART